MDISGIFEKRYESSRIFEKHRVESSKFSIRVISFSLGDFLSIGLLLEAHYDFLKR